MFNDRDFILDNFEEEEKDSVTTEIERLFPSIDESKLTDEQWDKLCSILNKGISKIINDLAKIDEDDDIPFW